MEGEEDQGYLKRTVRFFRFNKGVEDIDVELKIRFDRTLKEDESKLLSGALKKAFL